MGWARGLGSGMGFSNTQVTAQAADLRGIHLSKFSKY
jgi:hypothetical protein